MYRLLYCIRICKKTCINIYIYVYAFVDVHVLVCIFKVSFGACESFTGLLCPVSNLETFWLREAQAPEVTDLSGFSKQISETAPTHKKWQHIVCTFYGGLGMTVY